MEKSSTPYRRHLNSADDLITTRDQIRAGFVSLALERNRRATPYVEEARALKIAASKVRAPADLNKITGIEPALVTAAGISDKAARHMLAEDRKEAIQGLISKFLDPAGAAFVEELVFRFLLTKGDTLGGSMRNVGGALAQRRITRALLSALTISGTSYHWLHARSQTWAQMSAEDVDIELHLRGLAWSVRSKTRTLIYNVTVPIVMNNIDVVLLNCGPGECRSAYAQPERFILMGELKGGIDPAGADEHWKTAKTALGRIRKAFSASRLEPNTYFVGAAIAKKMATEIWDDLKDGILTNAANLTDQDQVASLCNWIVEL